MALKNPLQIVTSVAMAAIILGVSPGAFSANENFRSAPSISSTEKNPISRTPRLTDAYFASKLNTSGIALHPGSEHTVDDSTTPSRMRRCKSIVYQTLAALPKEHATRLTDLTLFYDKKGRRGLGGGSSIILRCLNVTDAELASVLVHEIGHLVDSSYFTGTRSSPSTSFKDFNDPVKQDDLSARFYAISWLNESTQKDESSKFNFVSLYAMSDPFEDFAETYNFYRLHGEKFRELAETNDVLAEKYEFMKNYVYDGEEWNADENFSVTDKSVRNYDVTVLPYSLKEFFSS